MYICTISRWDWGIHDDFWSEVLVSRQVFDKWALIAYRIHWPHIPFKRKCTKAFLVESINECVDSSEHTAHDDQIWPRKLWVLLRINICSASSDGRSFRKINSWNSIYGESVNVYLHQTVDWDDEWTGSLGDSWFSDGEKLLDVNSFRETIPRNSPEARKARAHHLKTRHDEHCGSKPVAPWRS